jgi:phosphotriesterase-related protein
VLGPVAPGELGFTLPHEHVFLDLWSWPGSKSVVGLLGIFDPDLDWAMMQSEVEAYRAAGGRSLVEVSLAQIGRAPEALKRLSQVTGVHIVMGCGWYRDTFYPDEIHYRPTDALAEELVHEIQHGAAESGIRPGIIGEIGFEAEYPTAREERVFRAAARASLRTGLAITTHTNIRTSGLEAMKILRQEGVPPDRIIIGHADCYPHYDYLIALLRQGCYVQFDCISFLYKSPYDMPLSADGMAGLTLRLVREGYAGQLLLSHDICHRALLRRYGGTGYTGLQERFLPLLAAHGVNVEAVHTLTVANPARVLAA